MGGDGIRPSMWEDPVMRRLFVYGTLRPGGGAFGRLLAASADGTAPALLPHHLLYGAGLPYPYVVPGPGRVVGDVVSLAGPVGRTLSSLDEYEGPEYERVEARLADGAVAWVYRAVPSVVLGEDRLIPSGDWFGREGRP
jgi:gamma-glutamylcyclotransferase (GGCT)/AIG2-like uncharacterized protein YtfP